MKRKSRRKPVKRQAASVPQKRANRRLSLLGVLNKSIPLSIPVKVVLLTASIYISSLVLTTILLSLFGISYNDEIFGMNVRSLNWLFHITLVAVAATASTHLFLDQPLSGLMKAITSARKGNFLVRVPNISDDELGKLSTSFNEMLSHITTLTATKIQTEQELLYTQRELKLKGQIDEQSKLIQENNKALESLVKDLSMLYEIGQGLSSTIELEELYRVMSTVLQGRLGLDKFAIFVKDDNNETMSVKIAYGFDADDHIHNMTFRIGEGLTGEAVQSATSLYIKDTTKEDRFLHYRGEKIVEGSFLSVPLIFKKDVLGAINFHRPEVAAFSEDDIRLLNLVANQIALAIENAKLYTKARELSVKDELTGLYNRRHFQTVLQIEWKRAVRFHRSLSLLMVDVDHFKKYNDTFGHLHGDKVLREMANLLRKSIREIDTVARFGGEEFIILLPDTDKKGALAVGEKLRKLVESNRFMDSASQSITPITISVGIASYPDDVREQDDLIDHADIALYDAKDSGRNKVICYPQLAIPANVDVVRNLKRPTLVS